MILDRNKLYNLLLLLLFVTVAVSAQESDLLGYTSLKPRELHEEITMVNYPLIVDVREYFEYKRSRLKDAVNIQSSGNLESTVDTLDKFSHIFLYCTTGFRSIRMAKFLVEKGFIHVYSLDGGIRAWKKAGLPVEKRKIRGSRKSKVGSRKCWISDFGFRIDSNQSWRGFSEAQSVTKLEEIADFGLRTSDFGLPTE